MSVEDINSYRDKVEKRVEAEMSKGAGEKGGGKTEPPLDFIRQCFMANEVGDSWLYNEIHQGKYIYNVITKTWMKFTDTHWVDDHNDETLAAMEGVVDQYLRLVDDYDIMIGKAEKGAESKKIIGRKLAVLGRISIKLRGDGGRKKILNCARSNSRPLTVHPKQLDQEPWLLPCANAVVDLRTGVARPGRPDDFLTRASERDWVSIDEPCVEWEKFLLSILGGNQEVVDFLQRVLGYTTTGLNVERLFLVLFGKHGQNGKGTLLEILYYVLGRLSGPIQTEMLMSQKFAKSSSGPSPDLMALKGKRLAWASESEEGQSFAAGRIKYFSGGDPIVGRGLNDKAQTTFMPSHVLFLLTNCLPHAPAHDEPFWTRINVIDFPLSFLRRKPKEAHERQADPELLDKLKSESSGILAWLVRGCLAWQKHGLAPPEKVLNDSLKYRRTEDDLQDFVEQCCKVDKEDPKLREPAAAMYGRYKAWWADQSPARPMSSKKFGDIMSRKGFERMKSNGKMQYIGIRILITVEGN